MNHIKRVSFYFRVLFQIVFVVLPLVALAMLMTGSHDLSLFNNSVVFHSLQPQDLPVLHPLSITTQALLVLVRLIPLGIELCVLYFLIKLFRLYENGEIFSIKNVFYIRNIGYALLIGQLINPFYDAATSLLLTWGNPAGQGLRMIKVSFDGTNLGILLTAALVILISWIMSEGCKLLEEQKLTV